MMPNKGDLRIYWIPQVPGECFFIPVKDLEQAILIHITLSSYDAFQYINNIKPDYCNAGGLEEFDGEEWCTWYDEDGFDFDEYLDNEEDALENLAIKFGEDYNNYIRRDNV